MYALLILISIRLTTEPVRVGINKQIHNPEQVKKTIFSFNFKLEKRE
jgi:hypothetical protein